MKPVLAFLISLFSFSTFATSLEHDLQYKNCSIAMKKTITIKKKEAMVEAGEIALISIFHNTKLKLKSGSSYPVRDVSQGAIAINQGSRPIFICVNDGDECLADLKQIQTNEVYDLSNRTLKIECQ